MDTRTSCKVDSLTQTYAHARQDGDIELALQIAFRLEDEKRGRTNGSNTPDYVPGRSNRVET